MCIICVKPAGVALPEWDVIKECFSANEDGAGFSWADGTTVHSIKGLMTIDAFKDAFDKATKGIDTTAQSMMLHFRIGTHGSKNYPGHTHPFPLDGDYKDMERLEFDSDAVVMHNGIICMKGLVGDSKRVYTKVEDDKDREIGPSDTMEFIANVIQPFAMVPSWNNNPKIVQIINNLLGTSKFAILYKDGRIDLMGASFIEHKGMFYSNSGYIVREPIKIYPKDNLGYGEWGYDNDMVEYSRNWLKDKYDVTEKCRKNVAPVLNVTPVLTYSANARKRFLSMYRMKVQEREMAMWIKWGHADTPYLNIIKNKGKTCYTPSRVLLKREDGIEGVHVVNVIDPDEPLYMDREQKMLFRILANGTALRVGDVSVFLDYPNIERLMYCYNKYGVFRKVYDDKKLYELCFGTADTETQLL